MSTKQGVALMVFGTFCLSFGSVLIKVAGNTYPTMQIIFARSIVTFGYCFFLVRRSGQSVLGHNHKLLTLRGILGFSALYCFFYAIVHLPLAEGTVLVFTFPVLVPFLAYIFLRERLEWMAVVCIVLGLAGVVMVAKPGFLLFQDVKMNQIAVSVALIGSLVAAFAIVIISNLSKEEHPLVIVLYAGGFGCIAAPVLSGWNWVLPDTRGWAMLFGVGICTSLGHHMMTKAFSHGSAARISGLFYLEVLFAVMWGFLVFSEVPDTWTWYGTVAIAIAAVSIGLRQRS